MFVLLLSGMSFDCTATVWISAACAAICSGVSKRMPCGAVVYRALWGWSEWQYAQRCWTIGRICANVTVVLDAGADVGRIQTAIAAIARAAAAGIHQSVRPAWRLLKYTRTSAPTAIRQTRIAQLCACPYVNGKWPASIVKRTGSVR